MAFKMLDKIVLNNYFYQFTNVKGAFLRIEQLCKFICITIVNNAPFLYNYSLFTFVNWFYFTFVLKIGHRD